MQVKIPISPSYGVQKIFAFGDIAGIILYIYKFIELKAYS